MRAWETYGRHLRRYRQTIHGVSLYSQDCSDGFLAAFRRRPEAYLQSTARQAMSAFSRIKRLDEESRALQRGLRRGRWADRHCLPVAPATIWLPAPWSILRARALLYRHQTGRGIRRKLHICHGWQVQLRLPGSRIADARPCAFVERISYRW